MELNKISNFIKKKRKELGITQEELAEKLFVTEKAISRWETGRGTPDISLLIPLSKELKIDVSELLNGEENKKCKNEVEQLIEYNYILKVNKFGFKFKIVIFLYVLSLLSFLFYLRVEYNPSIELNYLFRLLIIIISSFFIIISNKIYENNCVEKITDKKKILKFSQSIVFLYYIILMFNMVIFARYNSVNGYNIIPFKSIINEFIMGNVYSIIINVFGNFLIFMPLEYFNIELFKINNLSINFLLSFVVIFAIELFQFIFKAGVFDIDDLILRALGMMLFYFMYKKTRKKI